MNARQGSCSLLSQNSIGLRPIYQKVEQLIKIKQQKQQQIKKPKFLKIIQPVPKINVKLNVDRGQQFLKKRIQIETFRTQIKNVNKFQDTCTRQLKINNNKTKAQRIINFLKTHKSQRKIASAMPQITHFIVSHEHPIQQERQTFTPIRPISRISHGTQSISGTSLTKRSSSHRQSSGGYSQINRLSQGTSHSSTPSKYLRKGHRLRQALLKQIQVADNIQQEEELVYMRQYDQWVPSSLATFKKLELQHFLNILTGGKKSQKQQIKKIQPIYL